ncbi:DUF4062 domain-containing protein [Hymenobacter sp. DG01]|uniref:DUF4062 domain-containing protein n=1 Tax=Hymenobacter sp. DG01 TaxID=2584940 RepID=UPI00111DFFD7|nr:DUF4062 domain-containing protein [Hymenobacter sp. DG01]
MASLKIFVSSTSYDLGLLRSQLRNFCSSLGYDPITSENSDVLYDPRMHTHTSCVQEVSNCDVAIVIIGSRFGGKIIPKALEYIDIEKVRDASRNKKLLENPSELSITQLEVMKAIEHKIPIFTFIDNRVMHDHLVYEKNKNKNILSKIEFPSIEKPETAVYIFEFINFIRQLTDNNSIQGFSKSEDIENHLRKQWSGLFQRLLAEQRQKHNEEKQIQFLSSQLADIQTAIMTSIQNTDVKEIAKGAVKFRRVIEFLLSLKEENINYKSLITTSIISLPELLGDFKIIELKEVADIRVLDRYSNKRVALVRNDNKFYLSIYYMTVNGIEKEWDDFKQLNLKIRESIYDAIEDLYLTKEHFLIPLKLQEIKIGEYMKINNAANIPTDDDNDLPF